MLICGQLLAPHVTLLFIIHLILTGTRIALDLAHSSDLPMELLHSMWNNEYLISITGVFREERRSPMRVTGIIAECNPFHEGHRYLIHTARQKTGADYIVIALSGDYVQRGAPSILSREVRAAALLREGADLVLELPMYCAASGADYFARGAVALLESTGVVTDLCFGSESGDLDALLAAASAISNETDAFRAALREGLRSGLPYPQARSGAGEAEGSKLPNTPNDLLAAEYLRALSACGSSIRPHAVKRISCASASELRSRMISGRTPGDPWLCPDDLSGLLLHALYCARSPEDLSSCLDVSGDLAGRILRELPYFDTFSGFTSRLKTRNYTYTRISRALLHIALGMTREDMHAFDSCCGLCGWIRPIGFRRTAGPLLRQIAACSSVPFLDKLSRAEDLLPPVPARILSREIRAEFLYDLLAAGRTGQSSEGVKPGPAKPLVIL